MRSIICAVLLALAATTAGATEEVTSANDVMPGCRKFVSNVPLSNVGDAILATLCAGIVRGIAYTGSIANFIVDHGVERYVHTNLCIEIPPRVTTSQEVRVVIAYIDKRPERMHEPFDDLALEALQSAWPCR